MSILSSLPLWAVFVLTTVLFFVGYEAGHVAGRRRRSRGAEEKEELGSLVGAMLGLLGFIIAITFGSQLARYDAAKGLLLDEATAIYTTFLRADMLPDAARDETRELLYRYTRARSDTNRDVTERIREAERFQGELWRIAISASPGIPEQFPQEVYFDSLNEVIALHEKRVTVGISHRMPATFWIVLYVLAVLSFVVTGYHGGVSSGSRSPIRPIAVLGFAVLVMLVADLDDFGQGGLRVDQAALNDVADRMGEALVR